MRFSRIGALSTWQIEPSLENVRTIDFYALTFFYRNPLYVSNKFSWRANPPRGQIPQSATSGHSSTAREEPDLC